MVTANPAEVAVPKKLADLARTYTALASVRLVQHTVKPSGHVEFQAELQEPHPYICIATFKPSQFKAGKASQLDDSFPLLYFVERMADGSGTSSIGIGEDRTERGVIHVQNGYDVLTGHRIRESVMEQYNHAYTVLTSYRTMREPLMAIIERFMDEYTYMAQYTSPLGRSRPIGELGVLNTDDQIFRDVSGSLELLAQIAFTTIKEHTMLGSLSRF